MRLDDRRRWGGRGRPRDRLGGGSRQRSPAGRRASLHQQPRRAADATGGGIAADRARQAQPIDAAGRGHRLRPAALIHQQPLGRAGAQRDGARRGLAPQHGGGPVAALEGHRGHPALPLQPRRCETGQVGRHGLEGVEGRPRPP